MMKDALEDIGPFYSPTEAGADFIINKKIVKTEDREYANYDSSMFLPGVALADSKAEMAEILQKCIDLNEFAYKENEHDMMLKAAFETHVLGKFGDEVPEKPVVDSVADQAPEKEKPPIVDMREEIEKKEEKKAPEADVTVDEDALFKEIMEDLNE